MKTPEQLKGAIRNIAKEKDLHAQEVYQSYNPQAFCEATLFPV